MHDILLMECPPIPMVKHCYGAHCHVIERGSAACICLCAKCKDAKAKDH